MTSVSASQNNGAVRYGFVLDQTRCIGCHACTVACKSENQVPLGSFRTWVKYIDQGTFPDARRNFAVLRCNQCDDAPCMTICPTNALFRRDNGIVDFNSDACIGCKSCMQACPYDALYINPDLGTAAKCHLCAHRVDVGLQPACEIVCPTQAIISGDLDDPESPIAKIVASQPVQVRKPDQGTKPKVFYVGADPVLLDPRIERDEAPMFTDPGKLKFESADIGNVREVYDVAHDEPWGWRVWLYLWTKSIAAGVVGVPAALGAIGLVPASIGLAMTVLTTLLLIFDLKRPERFWYMLVRPNFRSWLVWGGLILGLFSAFCAAALGAELAHIAIPLWARIVGIALAAATAGYSAFLFNQARGRNFWQSPMLLWQLLVEAALCGAATLLLFQRGTALTCILGTSIVLQLAFIFGELLERRSNVDVRKASQYILRKPTFWAIVVAGSAVALALLALTPVVAAVIALAGALEYGRLWIKAGQSVKLS